MKNSNKIVTWVFRIIPAVILLQTLFFKFSGADVSVYIFETLGAEPVGRIGSGIVELIAGILLLIPRYSWVGAILAIGVMAGAIFSHLTILGIEVQGDGGQLFAMAFIVLITSLITLWFHRAQVPVLNKVLA